MRPDHATTIPSKPFQRLALGLLGAVLLSGCGSLGTKQVSLDYPSHREMIAAEFKDELWIPMMGSNQINLFAEDEARAPTDSLKQFCARDQGNFIQLAADNRVAAYDIKVKKLSGTFACKNATGDILWLSKINAINQVGGLQAARGYFFQVHDYALADYQADRAKTQAAEESNRQQVMQHRARFQSQAARPKSRGDSVCTWDNRFGFIDEVANDKVRILLKGKARFGSPGMFFEERAQRFLPTSLNEYIWDAASNWGQCNISTR